MRTLRWDPFEAIYLDEAAPDYAHYDPVFVDELPEEQLEDDDLYWGRNVTWQGTPGYMLRIDADNVVPMPTNPWNPEHMAAILESIKQGRVLLEAPPARVTRVEEVDVQESQRAEEEGELDEYGLTSPWTRADIGQYTAVLTDNNHRAFAAIAAGEPYIYVYVLPNYRDDIDPDDFE